MTYADQIRNEYFDWMVDLVSSNRYSKHISYRKLLVELHSTEFMFSVPNDINRAKDGIYLRYRFSLDRDDDISDCLDGPCSVLEMMVALAIRCEEDIMDNPSIGNRTGQWFWGMIVNLGLGSMTDDMYDKKAVKDILDRFLDRKYSPDGKGGLFTVDCGKDLRKVEIWYQMCWYLDSIV